NGDSSAPQGVRHEEELGGAPPVDPHKLEGAEGGRDPQCSTIGICQRRETLLLWLRIDGWVYDGSSFIIWFSPGDREAT
ncbi:hypothetical protein Tco_0180213, partial [Tanacetum coccineum]